MTRCPSVSVEPMFFLSVLGTSLYAAFLPFAFRLKVMSEYQDGMASLSANETDVYVQKRLTEWTIYRGIVSRPLLIVMTLFMGALSDIHGRKPVILLSLVSTCISTLCLNCFYSEYLMLPLWFILIQAFLFNLLGGKAAESLGTAYIVDKFPDKTVLALRLAIFWVVVLVAALIGVNLSGFLFYFGVSFNTIMAIAQVLVTLGFFYALFCIGNINPADVVDPDALAHAMVPTTSSEEAQIKLLESQSPQRAEANEGPPVAPPKEPQLSTAQLVIQKMKAAVQLEYHSIHTVFKPRVGSKRKILLLTLLFSSLSGMAEKQENELIGIYTQQAPFNWTQEEMQFYLNMVVISMILGTLIGMTVFKKILKLRDTTIILIGLFVNAIDVGTIALAPNSTFIYIGTLICDGLVFTCIPAAQSFIATLVPHDEVGKLYAAFAVRENLEMVFQLLILQPIYYFTVSWFKSCIWYILVLLNLIAFCVMFWVQREVGKDQLRVDALKKNDEPVVDKPLDETDQ